MTLIRINPNISIKQNSETWSLVIKPQISLWQRRLLFIWIICWSVCGIWVMAQYRTIQNQNEKIFIILYLAFWFYFEWSMVRVYIWKRFGKEKLWIKQGQLFYHQAKQKSSKIQSWPLESVGLVEAVSFNPNGFNEIISQSFWMKGHPRVQLTCPGTLLRFGFQLDVKTTQAVIKHFNAAQKARLKTPQNL